MRLVRETLADMRVRLEEVETTLKTLNSRVAESNGRQEAALDEVRAHAEQMRAHAEQMRAHAEQMHGHAEQMRHEVSQNTTLFDQAVAESVDSLEKYRRVVEHLVNRTNRTDKKQRALEKRVKAIEDKLAG